MKRKSVRSIRFASFAVVTALTLPAAAAAPETTSPPTSRPRRAWSHEGRLVLPELAGLTSYGALGGAAPLGGTGASGLVSVNVATFELPQGRTSVTSLSLRPVADYFVTDHFTVGGTLEASRLITSQGAAGGNGNGAFDYRGFAFSAMPRIGRTFDVGPVTIWPKLGVGYGFARFAEGSSAAYPAVRTLNQWYATELGVDVVVPLGEIVQLTLGPNMRYQRSSLDADNVLPASADSFTLGVRGHVGISLP